MPTTERAHSGPTVDPTVQVAALDQVDLTPLPWAMAPHPGDRSLLRPRWQPDQSRPLEPDAGVGPGEQVG